MLSLNCGNGFVPTNRAQSVVATTNSASAVSFTLSSGPGMLQATQTQRVQFISTTAGTAHITASTVEGATAACDISVFQFDLAPLQPPSVGDGAQFLALTTAGTIGSFTWALSGPGSMTTSSNGVTYLAPSVESPSDIGSFVSLSTTVNGWTFTTEQVFTRRPDRGLPIYAYAIVPNLTTNGRTVIPAANSFVASNGGPFVSTVNVTRTGTGVSSVQIDGLSLTGASTVQLTAVSSTAFCRVGSPLGDSFEVRCSLADGTPTDSGYTLRVLTPGINSRAGITGAFSTGTFTPYPGSPTGISVQGYHAAGTVNVTNTAAGTFRITLPTSVTSIADVQISTMSSTTIANPFATPVATRCVLSQLAPPNVFVTCFDPGGVAINSAFTISFADSAPVGRAAITDLIVADGSQLTTSLQHGSVEASSTGVMPTALRSALGRYTVRFAPIGLLTAPRLFEVKRVVGAGHCETVVNQPGALADIAVQCFNAQGQAQDASFQVVMITASRPTTIAVTGFARYSLGSLTATFSASGQAPTLTRASAGVYTLSFPGVSLTQADVQLTNQSFLTSSPLRRCATAGFQASDIYVRCFDMTNTAQDADFSVVVFGDAVASTARAMAWANVSALGTATSAENPAGAISASRASAGVYSVSLTGLTSADLGAVTLSARNSDRHCRITGLAAPTVSVQCFDASGAADSDFSLSVYADQPVFQTTQARSRSEVLAYAWLDQPTAASYTPYAPLTSNLGRVVQVSRSGPGQYSATFSGLNLGLGVLHTTPTSPDMHCNVSSASGAAATVRCYNLAGVLTDATLLLSLTR